MKKRPLILVLIIIIGLTIVLAGLPRLAAAVTPVAQQSGSSFETGPCPGFPLTVANETDLNNAIDCYNAIAVPGSYAITVTADFTLTTPTQPVTNTNPVSLQINGGSHTIDGAAAYRHFLIVDSAVTIDDLTLSNGSAFDSCVVGPNGCGGAIWVQSSAVLTLTNAILTGGTAGLGAGLYNQGGIVTINSSAILSNTGSYRGGGIGNRDGFMTIIDSAISGNSNFVVGGVSNEGSGTITITGSTINNNTANSSTGGLYNEGNAATISNSTISGNTAPSGSIGGVLNHFSIMLLVNTTIANNSSSTDSGFHNNGTTLTVRNSIFDANGGDSDCAGVTGAMADNTNLASDGSCGDAVQSATINLGPLQDNGGPTFTHALLSGSTAIDTGDGAICAAAPVNNLDQRGMTRPQGAECDVGAFEADALVTDAELFLPIVLKTP